MSPSRIKFSLKYEKIDLFYYLFSSLEIPIIYYSDKERF